VAVFEVSWPCVGLLLREMTETTRELSDLARPSEVQIVVSMVCKLVEMDGVVLLTVNGSLLDGARKMLSRVLLGGDRWSSADYQGWCGEGVGG
jgi:hypothetical protein